MKDLIQKEADLLERIYFIRGEKVMLDFDLAMLYGVQTKVLKQAVKRNIERFPDDFLFELSVEEFENLRSQIVTSSWGRNAVYALCFYGTRCGNVVRDIKI
jgi:hypothetical protein